MREIVEERSGSFVMYLASIGEAQLCTVDLCCRPRVSAVKQARELNYGRAVLDFMNNPPRGGASRACPDFMCKVTFNNVFRINSAFYLMRFLSQADL